MSAFHMSATLSPCETYRYTLERGIADDGPTVLILGVNPSTADAFVDDQTIRKDLGFGRRLGWGRLLKGNKFAYRATDVRALRSADDPIGPENDYHLDQMMREADIVIAAWGPLAKLPSELRTRWRAVVSMARSMDCELMCFGVAQDGQPRHTLMLAYDTPLVPWRVPS